MNIVEDYITTFLKEALYLRMKTRSKHTSKQKLSLQGGKYDMICKYLS